jgi:hypothetical protein
MPVLHPVPPIARHDRPISRQEESGVKIRITTVKHDIEPEEFEVPYDGFAPEFVQEVAKMRERTYRHEHFKTAISIQRPGEKAMSLEQFAASAENMPVKEYAKKQQIHQVALSLVEGEKTA